MRIEYDSFTLTWRAAVQATEGGRVDAQLGLIAEGYDPDFLAKLLSRTAALELGKIAKEIVRSAAFVTEEIPYRSLSET